MRRLYTDIVRPALAPLVRMTRRGMRIDHEERKRQVEKAETERDAARGAVSLAAGAYISPPQAPTFEACGEHPDFIGATRRTKCPKCEAIWRTAREWRASKAVKRATRLMEFDPSNKNHVRWLLAEALKLRWPASAVTETGLKSVKLNALAELVEMPSTPEEHLSLLHALIGLAHIETRLSVFLDPPLDARGYAHPPYTPEGTSIGRVRSGAERYDIDKATGADFNAQNIPEDVRGIWVPDPGYIFVEFDAHQIEWILTMILSRSNNALAAYAGGRDVHAENLGLLAPLFGWSWNDERERQRFRKLSKSFTHAKDYDEGDFNLARRMRVNIKVAKEAARIYFTRWPEIPRWHDEVEQEVIETRALRNPFNRQRRFFDVTMGSRNGRRQLMLDSKQRKEAISFGPASTNSDIWKLGLRALYDEGFDIVTGTHDSYLVQCLPDERERAIKLGLELLQAPIQELEPWIGVRDWRPIYKVKVGGSWGAMEKIT